MIEFHTKNNLKNAIVFIHGFTGGKDTWSSKNTSFPELLSENKEILDLYDICHFNYYTKLELFLGGLKKNIFTKIFKKVRGKKNLKNLPIEEWGNILASDIKFTLNEYDNIVIVAHSMGGLIAKSYILNSLEEDLKVSLFLSLAVPHSGSEYATFVKLFSSNVSIEELSPISRIIDSLNKKWVNSSNTPTIKYFYGALDEIVDKRSAVAIDVNESETISCNEDHISICKPEDSSSVVYKAVVTFLLNPEIYSKKKVKLLKLEDLEQYDDELFVLKLIIADVHSTMVKSVKEHFLNAEYVRKLFKSDEEQALLKELYMRIESVYKDMYLLFLSKKIKTSQELISTVHQKIIDENDTLLSSILPILDGYYKKGMLHQLANVSNSDPDDDVWWTTERDLKKLRGIK